MAEDEPPETVPPGWLSGILREIESDIAAMPDASELHHRLTSLLSVTPR
jgi:hypothetical protein